MNQSNVLEGREEGIHIEVRGIDFKRQHRAVATGEHATRHLMIGMVGSSGIMHGLYRIPCSEPVGELRRIRAGAFLAQRIAHRPAARQPYVERSRPESASLNERTHGCDHRCRSRNGAEDDVVMTRQRLSDGLYDNVSAKGDRPAVVGSSERVVDNELRAMLMGKCCESANIGNAHPRVGDRLDKNQARRLPERVGDDAHVGGIHICRGDAPALHIA